MVSVCMDDKNVNIKVPQHHDVSKTLDLGVACAFKKTKWE